LLSTLGPPFFSLKLWLRVKLDTVRTNLLHAIETLFNNNTWLDGSDPASTKKRGFGSALAAVIDYLGSFSYKEETLKGEPLPAIFTLNATSSLQHWLGRIMTFLSGYPSHGSGSMSVNNKFKQQVIGKDSRKDLYLTLATAAAEIGIAIDIVALSSGEPLALPTISSLATVTGGIIYHADATNSPNLPKDM